MIYTTGTIAGNGSTITGTGTNFTAAGSLIRVGCTLIAFTNPVQVLQLTAITSGTALSVTPAISPAIAAGTKYAILLSDSLSVDGLAQDIAETFGMYQKYMGGFADVMNGTGDVTITINGVQVIVPGQKSLAKKGPNSDITSLSGLTTALSVTQGGTGGNTPKAARAKLGVPEIGAADGNMIVVGAVLKSPTSTPYCALSFGSTETPAISNFGTIATPQPPVNTFPALRVANNGNNPATSATMLLEREGVYSVLFGLDTDNQLAFGGYSERQTRYVIRSEKNTTVDTSGFIKIASPIVKIFADGTAEINAESEGATVERLGVGEYLISGVLGMNSDAAWGGIDGGFDIPKDRNRQPLIWLDYEVYPDGSVLVKTHHRTHPDAPAFARNLIGAKDDAGNFTETVKNGDPVDIPSDQFVSVRVEMPADSIYNQNLTASIKMMEEAQRIAVEEAARKVTEEAQADPDQPHI